MITTGYEFVCLVIECLYIDFPPDGINPYSDFPDRYAFPWKVER